METVATPIISEGTDNEKRSEIQDYFNRTYDLDERLFECLSDDRGFFERPEPLRHPLIFYFGHTAVFYINKLLDAQLIVGGINERWESMFAVGVDEMSWDDLNQEHYEWPTVDQLRRYRVEVRKIVNDVISVAPLKIPVGWDDPFWVVLMCIEHQRIHLETSSVLIRQLQIGFVSNSSSWPRCRDVSGSTPTSQFIPVAGESVSMGRSLPSNTYGWDNEYGECTIYVDTFNVSKCLVSQDEYLEFVNDNGYKDGQWWSEEGWSWRNYKEAQHPPFWIRSSPSGEFRYRSLTEEFDLPMNWPVEVNFHEATAYCRWLSANSGSSFRLPTEAEWHCMNNQSNPITYPHWDRAPGNVNLDYFASACPVDSFIQGDLYDVVGNVWQWTVSTIRPFEGFKAHAIYNDFSTPTFDGRHNIIKGGSWISTGNEAHPLSRYAFRRHFYQHAGVRIVAERETK